MLDGFDRSGDETEPQKRLSAQGRSKRRILEPGVTAARPRQSTRAYSRAPSRASRAQAVSSSAVVVSRNARVVSSVARSGLAAS